MRPPRGAYLRTLIVALSLAPFGCGSRARSGATDARLETATGAGTGGSHAGIGGNFGTGGPGAGGGLAGTGGSGGFRGSGDGGRLGGTGGAGGAIGSGDGGGLAGTAAALAMAVVSPVPAAARAAAVPAALAADA